MSEQNDKAKENSNETPQARNPLWVDLVFSMTPKRKQALWLIASSVVFTVYCVPWVSFFPDNTTVAILFKISGWDWLALMVPVLIWYFIALRWMDKNQRWQ